MRLCGFFVTGRYLLLKQIVMKREFKTASQIRAEKEKLVMENFASVMKKLDDTFLVESKDDNVEFEEEDIEDEKED